MHTAADRNHPLYSWATGHHEPHFGQIPGAAQRHQALLRTFRAATGPHLSGATLAAACSTP